MRQDLPLQNLRDFCERLMNALRLPGDVLILEEDGAYWVRLEIDEPALLIGHRGENIFLIEHLLRRIANKDREIPLRIMADINRYRKHRLEALREMAIHAADEVRFSRKPYEFEPMPAYERRIVHTALSERSDVATESIGEGKERRVVVKAAP